MFDIKKFLETEARLTSPYKSARAEHRPDTAMGTDKAPFKGKLVGSDESVDPTLNTKLESEWEQFEAVVPPIAGTKPVVPGQTPPQSPEEKAAAAKAAVTAKTALQPTGIDPKKLAQGDKPTQMKLADVINKIASNPQTAVKLNPLLKTAVAEGPERLKGSGRADFSQTLGVGIGTNHHTYDEGINPSDKVTLDIPLLIRLLEYAREDAKTDMDLHDLTEKLIAQGSEPGKTLTMADYEDLVPGTDVVTMAEGMSGNFDMSAEDAADVAAKISQHLDHMVQDLGEIEQIVKHHVPSMYRNMEAYTFAHIKTSLGGYGYIDRFNTSISDLVEELNEYAQGGEDDSM